LGMSRIYLVRHVRARYVQERMTTPTPCVLEYQVATASAAWKSYRGTASACLNPADYVVIGFTATGACNTGGVPEFAPDWADVTSALALTS